MNLVLRFVDMLRALSPSLYSELNQLRTALNMWGAKEHQTDGTHAAISVTGLTFDGTTQTTVGAAGGASALPATPLRYLVITVPINGVATAVVVPVYVAS